MADYDEDWCPPTEGELKILEARRERMDKISKIMGQHLLKGYKMLATTCPKCHTILMRTRPPNGTTADGVDYCIACNELDSDISKDDPVLDSTAARSQVLESQSRTGCDLVLGMDDEDSSPPITGNAIPFPARAPSSDSPGPLQSSSPPASVDTAKSSATSAPATEARPLNPDGAVSGTKAGSGAAVMRMGRPDTGATQIESCTALGSLRKCDPPRVSSDEAGSRARCAMLAICPSVKAKDPTSSQSSETSGQHHCPVLPPSSVSQPPTGTSGSSSQSYYHHHHQGDYCPLHQHYYVHPSLNQHHHSSPHHQHHHPQNLEATTVRDALIAVLDKMNWAVELLNKSTDVEQSRQLCSLVTCCAEALAAIRSASSVSYNRPEERP